MIDLNEIDRLMTEKGFDVIEPGYYESHDLKTEVMQNDEGRWLLFTEAAQPDSVEVDIMDFIKNFKI